MKTKPLPIITILHDGEPITHMAEQGGSYATVCGIDGDDKCVGQEPTTTDPRSKINCRDCKNTWEICQEFKRSDFS